MIRLPLKEKLSGLSLFLDRDGVINTRIVGNYVTCPDDFHFIDGVPEAIASLSPIFKRIVVVTNQQGIGKALMTEADLEKIHQKMTTEIAKAGGRIDGVFYCPFLRETQHFNRKPNVGMGVLAKKQFPDISFKQSLMLGDMLTDMQFGKRLGMTTVLINKDIRIARSADKLVDYQANSLSEFVTDLLLLP